MIELLVVVAIIGILASVGVVAYNGYTESAKKAGVASNHANVMKFVGAELAKCNIDSKTMENFRWNSEVRLFSFTGTDRYSCNCSRSCNRF